MLIIHPDDGLQVLDSVQEYLEDEIPHYLVSGLVSGITRNPLVGLYLHLVYHATEDWKSPSEEWSDFKGFFDSRGGGGPSAQTQPPPTSSKKSRQARAFAQVGKSGGPARASQRGSRPRRKSCPKGHYWSFKQKKCVKSKFR